jgi:hypothetical protein
MPRATPETVRRPIVVTWCVARKTVPASARFMENSGSTSDRVDAWLGTLRDAPPTVPARDLYAGRAFCLAREAADRYGADLSVVSAGLGWVTATTVVPAYDVTVGAGGLQGHDFDLAAWWRSVVAGPFSTTPGRDLANRPLVLACVASAYASFFSDALCSVPRERLRIFGSGLAQRLGGGLSYAVMPYDDRLDVLVPGTRADFAQRALRHYLFEIGPSTDTEGDKRRIEAALAGLAKNPIRPGRSLGDEEIRARIRQTVAETGLGRTAMLRHFRDVLGIACEQSRFARLYREALPDGH